MAAERRTCLREHRACGHLSAGPVPKPPLPPPHPIPPLLQAKCRRWRSVDVLRVVRPEGFGLLGVDVSHDLLGGGVVAFVGGQTAKVVPGQQHVRVVRAEASRLGRVHHVRQRPGLAEVAPLAGKPGCDRNRRASSANERQRKQAASAVETQRKVEKGKLLRTHPSSSETARCPGVSARGVGTARRGSRCRAAQRPRCSPMSPATQSQDTSSYKTTRLVC